MQTISYYPIDAYQQIITNSQSTLDEAIPSSLTPMPLILQATVIVRDGATYDIYITPPDIVREMWQMALLHWRNRTICWERHQSNTFLLWIIHPPTQGTRLRYQLYRLGFRVLLLDEYRTSSSCPDCQGNAQKTNLKRISPRQWQRQSHGETLIHGLLECESTQCKSECSGQTKKWNLDVLASCNFRRIWHAYIQGGQRPDDLTSRGGNRDGDNYGAMVGNGNLQQ